MSESTHLKKNLGLGDVMGIALGQVIGSGIMTMTGIGIQMSGSGVTLAYIISTWYYCDVTNCYFRRNTPYYRRFI